MEIPVYINSPEISNSETILKFLKYHSLFNTLYLPKIFIYSTELISSPYHIELVFQFLIELSVKVSLVFLLLIYYL